MTTFHELVARDWAKKNALRMRIGLVGEWVFIRGDLWISVVSDELSDLNEADTIAFLNYRLKRAETSETLAPPPPEV